MSLKYQTLFCFTKYAISHCQASTSGFMVRVVQGVDVFMCEVCEDLDLVPQAPGTIGW